MMENGDALRVISQHRGDGLVMSVMAAAWEWRHISTKPDLDLPSGGAMGKCSSVGLGLALARPDRKVIVLDGDGSLLMNLGSLVTIANMAPPNLVHFVFENSVYRITGGQPIPNVGKFSFIVLAKEAGYANTYEFGDLESLEKNIETVLNNIGPTFVCLKLLPRTEKPPGEPPYGPINRAAQFREAMQRLSH
ncbi:thiamine pyrophosphate-dependent enzyme [Chloroflexota bacterium]